MLHAVTLAWGWFFPGGPQYRRQGPAWARSRPSGCTSACAPSPKGVIELSCEQLSTEMQGGPSGLFVVIFSLPMGQQGRNSCSPPAGSAYENLSTKPFPWPYGPHCTCWLCCIFPPTWWGLLISRWMQFSTGASEHSCQSSCLHLVDTTGLQDAELLTC